MRSITPKQLEEQADKHALTITSWNPGDGHRRYKLQTPQGRTSPILHGIKEASLWLDGYTIGMGECTEAHK